MKKIEGSTDKIYFNEEQLLDDLLSSAKALKIPSGVAESITKKILKEVRLKITKRDMISEEKLNRCISEVAQKYNPDLAYVYQNRGRII